MVVYCACDGCGRTLPLIYSHSPRELFVTFDKALARTFCDDNCLKKYVKEKEA